MLGYPLNCNIGAGKYLADFLEFPINNLGDPFEESNYGINTFEIEREVLYFFASFLGLEKYWGYISSGGSESNLWGLANGLKQHPDAVVYYSDQSHYSVFKFANMLAKEVVVVPSAFTGHIDIREFAEIYDGNRPAIIMANIGTTMTGAIDHVDKIKGIAKDAYVHCDAALTGAFLPLVRRNLEFDSIAISGHKFLGCPTPCSILLSRDGHGDRIDYLNSVDSTINGSRSGLAALALWLTIENVGRQGLLEIARKCMRTKKYVLKLLNTIAWPHWHNNESTTVMIKRPPASIVEKWQLACTGDWSHIIIMPHVTGAMLESFVFDLKKSHAPTNRATSRISLTKLLKTSSP